MKLSGEASSFDISSFDGSLAYSRQLCGVIERVVAPVPGCLIVQTTGRVV